MTALGLLAGLFTTACWVPQLARSLRTRSTEDLSWTYLAVLATGLALWLVYGIVRTDPAIIASNVLALGAVVLLITIKSSGPRLAAPAPGPTSPAGGPTSPGNGVASPGPSPISPGPRLAPSDFRPVPGGAR